jgi:tetratricopeptide (TPR) repeat protein
VRRTALLLAAVAVLLGLAAAVAAQETGKGIRRDAPSVDPTTGKRLVEAIEHLKADRHAQARAALGKLDPERLSPYERSRFEQIHASIASAQGDHDGALVHVSEAIGSGGLNEQELAQAEFQIAQLYMAQEKWREGIAALEKWLAPPREPNSNAYYLLAVAYYQLGQHERALAPAQRAIDLGDKPQESWLQLLLALRIEREEYREAVPILKRLIGIAPDRKSYWVQLSSVHARLGSHPDAAAPLQLAFRAGLLTEESELRRLAELLMAAGIPYRAALILDDAIEGKRVQPDARLYQTLANCWIASSEYDRAIQPLERAAEATGSGELFVRLGQLHVQREDWVGATDALARALRDGHLENAGDAQLLMGIAFYHQRKPREARTWFQRAREHASTKSQADGWLRHLEKEIEASSG